MRHRRGRRDLRLQPRRVRPAAPIPSRTRTATSIATSGYLRTGDLGRIDADGYIWITGRAKDLIIRGGHNIDPAEIEEALAGHHGRRLRRRHRPARRAMPANCPCAYVELVRRARGRPRTSCSSIARSHDQRARRLAEAHRDPGRAAEDRRRQGVQARPARRAITRVYNDALEEAGLAARVTEVVEDKKRGLVARVDPRGESDREAVATLLGNFTRPWDWTDAG